MQRRILIVDDEAGIRKLLATAFSRAAYEVRVAADATEAMALCECGSYDVILSDIVMPGKNGHELVRWVATCHPKTRIVLMSGFNDVECPACGVPSRPFSFLPKPFRPQDVVDRIEELLRHVSSV
jgi:DNA-binding NtrC family response regulator